MYPQVAKVEEAMALIGSRWCPAIMYVLILHGTQRFSKLRRHIPDVSQRMLTKQLRDLERAGLVLRVLYAEVPLRVEYSATELGISLAPIYQQVCAWADKNGAAIVQAQQQYDDSASNTKN